MRAKLYSAIIVVVVGLGLAGFLVSRHYQVAPLPSAEELPKPVYEAHNPHCPDPSETGRIPVFLEAVNSLGDQPSVVRYGSEELSLGELQTRLKSIFATRADRTIYVLDAAAIKRPHQSPLVKLLLPYDFIDRICVVDPKDPPKWYPPLVYKSAIQP